MSPSCDREIGTKLPVLFVQTQIVSRCITPPSHPYEEKLVLYTQEKTHHVASQSAFQNGVVPLSKFDSANAGLPGNAVFLEDDGLANGLSRVTVVLDKLVRPFIGFL